jgi:fermentation-respiration switch protein FrsA (DUF1100 family)
MLFFPERSLPWTPRDAGLDYEDLTIATSDGERLHGWWIPARDPARHGHVLVLHGNGGNISGRVELAQILTAAGLDVLLLDYRGYGRSTGRPSEQGTYRDAAAGREALLSCPGVDPERVFYLGESLGGAVALWLALESPPSGVILQSTFTSVRDVARIHYSFIPALLVPDAYPSLQRVRSLRAPALVLHGDRDDVVPLSQGRRLYEAAASASTKRIHVFEGAGHNDIELVAADEYARVVAAFVAASSTSS